MQSELHKVKIPRNKSTCRNQCKLLKIEIFLINNFHYVAVLMMTSQILKPVNFTKTQKSWCLESKTFFLQIKKLLIKHQWLLYEKEQFCVAEVTFKKYTERFLMSCHGVIWITQYSACIYLFKVKNWSTRRTISESVQY